MKTEILYKCGPLRVWVGPFIRNLGLLLWLWTWGLSAWAQPYVQPLKEISPREITASESKTTHIIFPGKIQSIDLGHAHLMARILPGNGQILSVKAAMSHMESTTLTVITEEGGFYSFLVSYESDPSVLNWVMESAEQVFPYADQGLSEEQRARDLQRLEKRGPSSYFIRDGMGLVDLQLRGVYVHGDTYYIKGWIRNRSYRNLKFRPLAFWVQTRTKGKRNLLPGREVLPLGNNPPRKLDRGQILWWVIPLPEFGMGPREELLIRLEEEGGPRVLQLRLSSSRWSRAIPLDKSGY